MTAALTPVVPMTLDRDRVGAVLPRAAHALAGSHEEKSGISVTAGLRNRPYGRQPFECDAAFTIKLPKSLARGLAEPC